MLKLIIPFLLAFSEAAHAGHVLSAGQIAEYEIGKGYDDETEQRRGKCITPVIGKSGRPDANVYFTQTMEQRQISSSLGFGASGEAKYGAAKYSGAANFYKATASNGFSLTSTYSGDYKFKNDIMTSWTMSPDGARVQNDQFRFRKACGNEFVEQITQGAKLFFTIRIDFASQEDKQTFDASFGFSSSMASAQAYLKQASQSFSKNSQVTVGVYQMGGKVDRVTQIFQGSNPTPKESLGFVKCTFGDFAKCDQVLANALDYATDITTGFPSQLNEENTDRANLEYVTQDYISLGLFPKFDSILERVIIEARKSLEAPFYRHLDLKLKVDGILGAGVVKLSPPQRKALTEEAKKLETNVNMIGDAAQTCYAEPHNCQAAVSKTLDPQRGIQEPNESVLNISPETYLQYCYLAQSISATVDLKQTIEGMLAVAEKMAPSKFIVQPGAPPIDKCSVSHQVFRDSTELSFRKAGLKTLEPLRDLHHLQKLDLSENDIRNLSGLDAFEKLEDLNLRRNSLKDISVAKNLTALQRINLESNNLRSTAALDALPELTYVDIQNNNLGVKCPRAPQLRDCLETSSDLEISFTGTGSIPVEGFYPSVSQISNDRFGVYFSAAQEGEKSKFMYFDLSSQKFTMGPQPLVSRIGQAQVTLANGRVVILGGEKASRKIEVLDNGAFQLAPVSLTVGRKFHNAVMVKGDKILVTGGFGSGVDIGVNPLQTAELIDPATWTVTTINLQNPRGFHTTTVLPNGEVMLLGSWSHADASPTAEILDPVAMTSKLVTAKMNEARGAHSASLIGNKIMIAGGFGKDGKALASIEFLDLTNKKFSVATQSLTNARGLHTASILSMNRVVVAGGQSEALTPPYPISPDSTCLDSAELVDISRGIVTPVRNTMRMCRVLGGQIPASDSSVFLFGGGHLGSVMTYDTLQFQELPR